MQGEQTAQKMTSFIIFLVFLIVCVPILPSTYQILLKLVEIWRSSNKNKNAQFFWDKCITAANDNNRNIKL